MQLTDLLDTVRQALAYLAALKSIQKGITVMDIHIRAPKIDLDRELDDLRPIDWVRLFYAILKSRTILLVVNGEDINPTTHAH